MRIGLVIERMEPWRGGAETSTAQFARELIAMGHEVALFTASRGVSEPGVQVQTLAVPRTRARRAELFRSAVRAALADWPCDVVHSMTVLYGGDVFMPRGGTVGETIAGNLRARRSPAGRAIKRLLNLFNRKQRVMLRLERRLLGSAGGQPGDGPRRIVAISNYVAEQLRVRYRVPDERIAVVFNGVTAPRMSAEERSAARAEVRRQWGVGSEQLLLLFVGHNFRLKGLAPLLDGLWSYAARTDRRDWRLMVVGRDRPGPYVRQADRLHLADRVLFVGASERMWRFYAAADLLVLPTFYDPCSRVVLEAVSLHLPAITSRYNGAAEILVAAAGRPAPGAVVGDPHDAGELARTIAAMAEPQRLREAQCAAAQLGERLAMRRHAEEMVEVYRQLKGDKADRQ